MARIDPNTVAFDIDGVVADTMTLFLGIAREKYGINGLTLEQITSYDLTACLPMDQEILHAIGQEVIEMTHARPLTPLPGAEKGLAELAAKADSLVFVTARPLLEPIEKWIHALVPTDPENVTVVATGSFEAKADVLADLGRTWFVEDRLETCFTLAETGISPVVFAQPWNRRPHPFLEVVDWEELCRHIDRM